MCIVLSNLMVKQDNRMALRGNEEVKHKTKVRLFQNLDLKI
jgi:hypothetical protein